MSLPETSALLYGLLRDKLPKEIAGRNLQEASAASNDDVLEVGRKHESRKEFPTRVAACRQNLSKVSQWIRLVILIVLSDAAGTRLRAETCGSCVLDTER